MFTSKELFGLEAELRAVHDNAGAEVARQCALKMWKMEAAIQGIISGFSPRIGDLKELVGHIPPMTISSLAGSIGDE